MKVNLSIEAAEQLQQLLDYLEINWSVKVRDNFHSKTRPFYSNYYRKKPAFTKESSN